MPEPLIGESITDVDGTEAGEVEFDATGVSLVRTRNGGALWAAAVEAEVRLTGRLGLAFEAGISGPAGGARDPSSVPTRGGLRVAAGFALLHDFKRDFHVQLKASARLVFTDDDKEVSFEPTEPGAPYAVGLHAAWRRGRFNLRADVGADFGGTGAGVPVYGSLVGLLEWGGIVGRQRRGFVGLELAADGNRRAPFLVGPELAINIVPFDWPVRIGLVVPVTMDVALRETSIGGLLRVVVVVDRD